MQASQIMIKILGIARYRRKTLKEKKGNEIQNLQEKPVTNNKHKNYTNTPTPI